MLRLIASGYTYKETADPPAHLGPHGGNPRLGGPAQAAALQPPRAEPLGRCPQSRLTGRLSCLAGRRRPAAS